MHKDLSHFEKFLPIWLLGPTRLLNLKITVRPRDTRPQAARTSTMHVFE